MNLDKAAVKQCRAFLLEREFIREKKEDGAPKPWTRDPILQQYKFTNTRREDDRVTIWVRENIRERFAAHSDLWWMLCAARQINWPDTLAELIDTRHAWPVIPGKWKPERMLEVLRARAARGDKVYTGAYMISGQGAKGQDKPSTTVLRTLAPLWEQRNVLSECLEECETLAGAYALLRPNTGFGGFLTAQVIADLKHTRYLETAEDYWNWAVLGPGSTRGLNRLYARHGADTARRRPLNLPWPADLVIPALQAVRKALGLPWQACLQEIQNNLCEFQKYERTRLGEGRPRATYPGRE